MKTKLFFLYLALAYSVSIFADDFYVNGICYNILGDNSVEVTSNGYTGSITIPEEVEYHSTTYRVTAIGAYAFNDCSSLTKVTIPNSVTAIGEYAFSSCSSLTEVTIPNSVIIIGDDAFQFCSSLTAIIWNAKNCANFSSSYPGPFYDIRSQITAFTFGDSVQHIPAYLCYGMSQLTAITIPHSVTTIGNSAFYYCSNLTEATLPNSLIFIGDNAFCSCRSLTSITIPESVNSIGSSAFYGCSSLTEVTMGNSVTSIDSQAFYNCLRLTAITIPNSVTTIGNDAFYGCSSLTEVTWTAKNCDDFSSSTYGCGPFFDICSQITSFIFGDSVLHIPAYLCCGMSQLTTITIPESVISIGSSAFTSCSSLTTITLPNSVTSIGSRTFYHCEALTDITIPSNITTITEGMLSCTGLTSIDIPNSVKTIETDAFYYCRQLNSVIIPNSINSIDNSAFRSCAHIDSIVWNVKKCNDFSSGLFSNSVDEENTTIVFGPEVERIPAYLCNGLKKITSITIPESVTSIGNYAFKGCYCLENITVEPSNSNYHSTNNCLIETASKILIAGCKNSIIPTDGSVTTIGDYAFYGCSSLTDFTIPNSVTTIGDGAFYDCTSFTNVTIENSVTNIGDYAFYRCSGLTAITIPNYVTTIGDYAFDGCSNLTDITWNAKNCTCVPFGSIASQINSFTLGNKVETIPATLCSGMNKITSITVPNSVTAIETSTFENCTNLRQISLGSGIEQIAEKAFAGCTGLVTLSIGADFPPIAQANTFQDVSTTAIIKVPCGASDLYKAASYWNTFTNYQAGVVYNFSAKAAQKTQGKVTIHQQPDCESDGVAIFEAVPYQGYEFTGWSDGSPEAYRIVEVTEDVEYLANFISTSAEEKTDSVVVNPSEQSVDFTWPAVEGAKTYVFVIYADEARTDKICTVTCNEFGQLTNLDFARSKPARNQETPSGLLNFTITGLDAGTTYSYTLDSYDEEDALLIAYSGMFTTTGTDTPTGVETPYIASPDKVNKVLENGTIYILRNGEKYTVDGRRVM